MGLISLLFQEPLAFAVLAVSLLYSVIAHEVSHGLAASFFGDDTAKRAGRLTLNPLPHLDPIGALLLFFVGFGWARPVPVSYVRLSRTRLGMICVAMAGCVTNAFLAAISIFLLRSIKTNSFFREPLEILALINVTLGAFNLIPIPPLDGSKVLLAFLPKEKWGVFAKWERYGLILLIVLMVTGVLKPVILYAQNLIYWLIAYHPT